MVYKLCFCLESAINDRSTTPVAEKDEREPTNMAAQTKDFCLCRCAAFKMTSFSAPQTLERLPASLMHAQDCSNACRRFSEISMTRHSAHFQATYQLNQKAALDF